MKTTTLARRSSCSTKACVFSWLIIILSLFVLVGVAIGISICCTRARNKVKDAVKSAVKGAIKKKGTKDVEAAESEAKFTPEPALYKEHEQFEHCGPDYEHGAPRYQVHLQQQARHDPQRFPQHFPQRPQHNPYERSYYNHGGATATAPAPAAPAETALEQHTRILTSM